LNWGGGREGKGRGGGWAINLVLGTTTERARYKLLYLSLLFIYLFIYFLLVEFHPQQGKVKKYIYKLKSFFFGGFSPSPKARKNQLVKSLSDIYYIFSLSFSPLFSVFSHEYRSLIQDFFFTPLTGLLPDLAKSSLGIIIILAASMVIGLFSEMLEKKKF
jgi:hypothetical protein